MTPASDEPTVQAQAIIERVLRLVTECRTVRRALERPSEPSESSSAGAERILYFRLMSAIDAGLIKTMEDALKSCVTRASRLDRWGRVVGTTGANAGRKG